MKKNILKISIISILSIVCILMMNMNAFAMNNITIETKTDSDIYAIESIVTVNVEWNEAVQAAGFTLTFDDTKLSFEEASIKEDFYNISQTGDSKTNIKVRWASLEETDKTSVTFKLKTLAEAETTISITEANDFSNGNLEIPGQIDYQSKGSKTIKIVPLGDVNLDGKVNAKDLVELNKYINGLTQLSEEALQNADVCHDGEVNKLDVDILNKYLNGWAITFPFKYGDINNDGMVNTIDVMKLNAHLKEVKTLTLEEKNRADVNLDGIVDEKDRIIISRAAQGWEGYEKLPIQITDEDTIKFIDLDDNNKAICGFDVLKMKISDFISNFKEVKNISVYDLNGEILTDNNYAGTGMTIKIDFKNKEEITEGDAEKLAGDIGEYIVILYGDTTGDGKVNAIDALALIKDINNKIPLKNEACRQAGRIISQSPQNPTAVDALAIVKYVNGKFDINQSK